MSEKNGIGEAGTILLYLQYAIATAIFLLLFTDLSVQTLAAQDEDLSSSEPELLRVAINRVEPFVFLGEDEPRGFSIDLWDAVANEADLAYEFVEVENVAALLAVVEAGEVDLGIGATTITADREELVDFSLPFFASGLQILAVDIPEQGILSRVRGVFNTNLLSFLGAAFLILLLIAHVAWLLERDENPEFMGGYIKGIGAALYWTIVTASTVGYGDTVLRDRFGKLLAVVWMLLSLFLVSYFTATVTTSLTVNQLQVDINGPEDLRGQNVITLPGTTSSFYLLDRGIAFDTVANVDVALAALESQQADAFVYDAPVLQYLYLTREHDSLRLVPTIFQDENYGIVLQQGSLIEEEIDLALLTVQENGVYDQIHRRWFGQ